jgi:ABC-type transporter Mla subunit MlaD
MNTERLEKLKSLYSRTEARLNVSIIANDLHNISVELKNYAAELIKIADNIDNVADIVDDTIDNIQYNNDINAVNEYITQRTNRLCIPAISDISGYGDTSSQLFDESIKVVNEFYNKQLHEINELKTKIIPDSDNKNK